MEYSLILTPGCLASYSAASPFHHSAKPGSSACQLGKSSVTVCACARDGSGSRHSAIVATAASAASNRFMGSSFDDSVRCADRIALEQVGDLVEHDAELDTVLRVEAR